MGKSGSLPRWQLCRGISGSFRVEWVAGFVWNQWQPWSGIRTILDAVDDDSPGVPSMGCEAALTDLIERISAPEGERGIDAPELQDMLVLMETAFGRAEIRIETDDR